MNKLLEVHNLDAFYGKTQVLFNISFGIEAGTITTILGANGAGKTTALRAICQTVNTRGEVLFQGRRVDGMMTEDIVRFGIAHVPDGRGTFAALSVEENLRLGAYSRNNKVEMLRDIDIAYERFPRLKERQHQQAGTLSGGEQQMLAISRALMLRPTVLLLDEPSFGLAPMVIDDIFKAIQRLCKEEKVSILLVEQNASLALTVSDYAYVLETGHVVLSGTAEAVCTDQNVRHSYLGT